MAVFSALSMYYLILFSSTVLCVILWSAQLTSALISAVIYFALRVGVMKRNTKQHMTSSQ